MAVIEKIRRRSGLLIAFIGVALLAFVLQDLFQSSNRGREYNIAVVNGEKIPYQDFDQQAKKNIENQRRNQGVNSLSSEQTLGVYNSTLEQMIANNIMTKEYEALGMNVSEEELYEQFAGEEPHPWVVQTFTDANGNFDRNMLNNYLSNIGNFAPEAKAQWFDFEKQVQENRLQTKFENLVKASYFVPAKLAQKIYENRNNKVSADVIAYRYSNIADSTVVVTDKDNQAFYNENKYKYETDESRGIEYVVFEVKPSQEDIMKAAGFVDDMKQEFAQSTNVANFVNANSDRRYDSTWKSKKDVSMEIDTILFNQNREVGFVFGPYRDGETFNLVRVMDVQMRSDSLRASHILVPFIGSLRSMDTVTTKEVAKMRADSILNALKNAPKNAALFGELAAKYSSDGSKDKEGDLDWFTDGMMVYAFNEFVVKNPVGTLGVVETPFGYHVIKVTGKNAPQRKMRLAFLTHEVAASTETYQHIFAQANKFVTESTSYEAFNESIEKEGLTKRTMPRLASGTYQIAGIKNPRQIVRWAFDSKTKLNDISSIFDLDDMFVVAALTKVIPEGYAPLTEVAEQLKYQILNKKKGEVAIEKMKACGDDYQRMVNELGAESTSVNDVTVESRALGNFGVESNVIGMIMGMKDGEVAGPVAGNTSAFVIRNVKHTVATPTQDYSNIEKELNSRYTNSILNGGIYNALRKNAKVEDNRAVFY